MTPSPPANPDGSPEGQGSSKNASRTLAELQAYQARVSVLQEIATAITRRLSLNEILQEVKQRVKWLLDFDHCSIYLKQQADTFQLITLFGPETTQNDFNIGSDTNLIEWAIQTKQSQLIKDRAGSTNASSYRAFIIVLLESEGETLGTLNFASRYSYNFNDLRLCNLLSMQLVAAIRNAQRFEEINHLYAELEQTYANLRQVEDLRDDLTRIIVHDLRNPLNVVLGSLEILELVLNDANQAAAWAKWVRNAQEAGQQMLNMVDDLLDVSRLDSQQLPLNLTPVDIAALLVDKAQFYQPQAEQDKKMLTVQAAPQLPLVMADTKIISRILDNLIGNAFKYTDQDGQIELKTGLAGPVIEVTVADDGQGIPVEYHQRIFDKFIQVLDGDDRALRKGTGLGLAFCRLAVEAHGGYIWVDSAPGQGSAFTFTLPL